MNLIEYTILFSSVKQKLAKAEAETERNPSEAKIKAENYKKGKLHFDGMKISIENPRGSVRRGKDKNGKPWSVKMKNSYGYINGIKSVDGDDIDIFLSKDPSKGNVYIVDQVVPGTNKFDEHKIMYGFGSLAEAKKAYLANYNKGWKGLGKISELTKDQFKAWLKKSNRKSKPYHKYKEARK